MSLTPTRRLSQADEALRRVRAAHSPTLPLPRTPAQPPRSAADQAAFEAASHVRTTPAARTTRGR